MVVQPLLAEPQQPQVALGVEGAVGAEPELPVGLHLPVQVLQRLVHLAEGVVQVLVRACVVSRTTTESHNQSQHHRP